MSFQQSQIYASDILSVHCEVRISSYKLIPANLARGEATSTHVDTNVNNFSEECLQNNDMILGTVFLFSGCQERFLDNNMIELTYSYSFGSYQRISLSTCGLNLLVFSSFWASYPQYQRMNLQMTKAYMKDT